MEILANSSSVWNLQKAQNVFRVLLGPVLMSLTGFVVSKTTSQI